MLLNAQVPIEEIIAGGGGEAKGTQRLRRGLQDRGWTTKTFTIVKSINNVEREDVSHKMDHVKAFPNLNEGGKEYTLALEIEWNNKDPFFDRGLENFKRLHAVVGDKFGEATTHWRKLEDRVNRGVGNPCPLVLIGLPDSIVTFGEDEATVRRIIATAQTDEAGS